MVCRTMEITTRTSLVEHTNEHIRQIKFTTFSNGSILGGNQKKQTMEQRDFLKLRSVLDIVNCRGKGYDRASNMSFEVVNLFLFTYHYFYLVIPGAPGAGELNM